MIFWQIGALLEKYEATLKTPVKELSDDAVEEILYGSDDRIKIKSSLIGTSSDYFVTYEGVVKYIQMLQGKGCFCYRAEVGGAVCPYHCLSGM